MSQHPLYKYSITIRTPDEVILYCIRSIAMYAQRTGNNRITWGGTTVPSWNANRNMVTFRFTQPHYREIFKDEMKRILPQNTWTAESEDDNNPR